MIFRLTDETVRMLSRGFETLFKQSLEQPITGTIQAAHDVQVFLFSCQPLYRKKGSLTRGILKGAASKPILPPGEFESMNPKSI